MRIKRTLGYLAAIFGAVFLAFACNDPAPVNEPEEEPEPFPLVVKPASLDTTMVATQELNYTFWVTCYNPNKVHFEFTGGDGMAPQVSWSAQNQSLIIWDTKRWQSIAYTRIRVYDDISEQIVKVTVHEKR